LVLTAVWTSSCWKEEARIGRETRRGEDPRRGEKELWATHCEDKALSFAEAMAMEITSEKID